MVLFLFLFVCLFVFKLPITYIKVNTETKMSAAPSLKTSSTTSFLDVSLSLWKFRAKEDGKERPALT